METVVDKLLLEFFLTIARFEYALKSSGFHVPHAETELRQPPAEPNWGSYAVELRQYFRADRTPELRAACEYISDMPPNRQVLVDAAPAWDADGGGMRHPEIDFLLLMVRRVRNNLFHGGKHGIDPHESKERTEKLLSSCLALLAECLELSPNQKRAYDEAVL